MWDLWFSGLWGMGFGLLGVAAFFLLLGLVRAVVRVTSPNYLFVVTGRRTVRQGRNFGFAVDRGRTTVIPYLQSLGSLDLGVYAVNVKVEGVNSANGITMGADATACVCIDDSDDAMVYNAVERLMGKDRKSVHEQIQQTLVGNFRGALNKATPLQAIGMDEQGDGSGEQPLGERAMFRAELLDDINSDLRAFGMKVVSVSLQKIWDTSNYIANLAQKTLAEKRQQVEIEESRLRAIADQAESDSRKRVEVARATADEAIIAARQELELYRRESAGQIEEARLTADQDISRARNAGEALVQAEQIVLSGLDNLSRVVIEAEAREEASRLLAEGDREATAIRLEARNQILERKARLVATFGDDATGVMFLQQKLPELYQAYHKAAEGSTVDALVVMDDKEGFSGAVNRGARAFSDLLKTFADTFGIDIKDLAMPGKDREVRS